jgi:hypothetical protein
LARIQNQDFETGVIFCFTALVPHKVIYLVVSSSLPNASTDLSLVRDFERQLDSSLLALPSVLNGGDAAISLSAKLIEEVYARKEYGTVEHLKTGLEVLAPYFVRSQASEEPDITQLFQDLIFAGHYYDLRDYLYYTYNAPGAISWTFGQSTIDINFNDRTIPRQYYLQANNHFVISMERFADFNLREDVIACLRSKEPVKGEPIDEAILNIIEKEIEIKLGAYFNFLSGEAVSLGDYLFSEFEIVFKVLLVHALFHRYHGEARQMHGPVYFDRGELLNNLVIATELSAAKCDHILSDIAYGIRALNAGIQPMYFSLYELEQGRSLVMMPSDFAIWEGFIDILRITAIRTPKVYLREVSHVLSEKFVQKIAEMFRGQGFQVAADVKLSNFDSRLPDIDLLVISEEVTLGYVVLPCELKTPIPPQWAKDHLRVLGEDSVIKGFDQLDQVSEFLRTPSGINFLRGRLPDAGLPHFDGFVVATKPLIITSRNAGMFFGDKEHTIIDYITLDRALKRCDGDMAFLLRIFSDLNMWLDEGFGLDTSKVLVGEKTVHYDVMKIKHLIDFSTNEYKSVGIDKQMLAAALQDGYHPFEVFDQLDDISEKDDSDAQ